MLKTRLATVSLAVLFVVGCHSFTSERIAALKGTPEGREKLVEAVRDPDVAVDRRAEAAAALAEVGWVDRVESVIAATPLDDRARLLPAIVPLVSRGLAAGGPAAGEARETLFALRRQATTEAASKTIDAALLPSLEGELRAGRGAQGRHSVKEMLIAIGAPAQPLVAKVIADGKAPYEAAVEVLDKIGDKAGKEAGGAALVARARAGEAPTPALWKALGTLGGPQVNAYLQEQVEQGGPHAEDAARTLVAVRRDRALLPFALKVAGDHAAKPAVREQMLTLAQGFGGDDARQGLVRLIGSEPDPTFRFRIFEAAVKGDAKAILPGLEAFPEKAAYDPAAVREHLVAPLTGMGWPAREGIFKALKSSSALARLTAVWALEKVGFESDAPQVAKLSGDRGKVKGVTSTIGAEATRIAAALKKPAT